MGDRKLQKQGMAQEGGRFGLEETRLLYIGTANTQSHILVPRVGSLIG